MFFIGSSLIGILLETGNLVAFVAAAFAGAMVSRPMFKTGVTPLQLGLCGAVAAIGFAGGLMSAAAARPTYPMTTGSALSQASGARQADPSSAPKGWLRISYWEDSTDFGDYQTYDVDCDEPVKVAPPGNDGASISNPKRVCAFLRSPAAIAAQRPAATSCSPGELATLVTAVGDLDGRSVSMSFLDGPSCTNAAKASAVVALAPDL